VLSSATICRKSTETRYPGEYDEIIKEEYEESITITTNCFEWVENKFKENNKGTH
jgi:hypothetical protein